jgi:hypothetical protein
MPGMAETRFVDELPPRLRAEIGRAPERVRPLRPPQTRALLLLPLGLGLMIAVPLVWGWRSNLLQLGPFVAWGLSATQALAGIAIVGAALREAIPGRELSGRALVATAGAALALFTGLTWLTSQVAPFAIPPGVFGRWFWECFATSAEASVPALAAAAWLASRALPTRPIVAGGLYGLGAGLMADAGLRLYCQVSTPLHVILAHGAAILVLAGSGALAATLIGNGKAWWQGLRTRSEG